MATRISTPRAKLRRLRVEADAAEHRRRRELQMLAVGPDGRLDLRRELARRRQDQRAQRLAHARRLGGRRGGQALQHRQHEAGGLAGAGLRAGQEVAARQHDGNRLT